MKELVRYWQFDYDWRKQEQLLNDKLPSFKVNIDGLDIHFAHVKVIHRCNYITQLNLPHFIV
jgi:hypothetical protein